MQHAWVVMLEDTDVRGSGSPFCICFDKDVADEISRRFNSHGHYTTYVECDVPCAMTADMYKHRTYYVVELSRGIPGKRWTYYDDGICAKDCRDRWIETTGDRDYMRGISTEGYEDALFMLEKEYARSREEKA